MADDVAVGIYFHPRVVTHQVDEAHHPYLSSVTRAFSVAQEALKDLADARAAASKNQAWNKEQRTLIVGNEAEKALAVVTRSFDAARKGMMDGIAHINEELSQPLVSAADNVVSAEIRNFVKNLSTEKRHAFMTEALNKEDLKTLNAVLGAGAPYLSGLTDEFVAAYTRQLHVKQNPVLASRLAAMERGLGLVEERGPRVFLEIEKALGATFDELSILRKNQSNAEAALAKVGRQR